MSYPQIGRPQTSPCDRAQASLAPKPNLPLPALPLARPRFPPPTTHAFYRLVSLQPRCAAALLNITREPAAWPARLLSSSSPSTTRICELCCCLGYHLCPIRAATRPGLLDFSKPPGSAVSATLWLSLLTAHRVLPYYTCHRTLRPKPSPFLSGVLRLLSLHIGCHA